MDVSVPQDVAAVAAPAKSFLLVRRLIRGVASKGFWALSDQGIVSATDFLATFVIARWLGRSQLGVYDIVLNTILWINALQSALVLYPLTIRGAGGDRKALRGPTTAALLLTLLLAPLLCGASAIGGAFISGRASVALGAAFAMILWQLQETVRQALKTHLRFAACIPGDCIRHLGQLAGLWLLHRTGRLDVASAFALIGLVSAAATVVQALQVGLVRIGLEDLVRLAQQYWVLGRWMLLAGLLSSVTSIGFLWVLQYFHGTAQVGLNAAIAVPFKVVVPITAAMTSVITPSVAKAMKEFGAVAAVPIARQFILLGALLLAPYFLFVLIQPRIILHIFLGSRYVDYLDALPLVRLYLLNFVIVYVQVSLTSWLGGLGQSRLLFATQVAKTVVGLVISLPMTAAWGEAGLILGNILALTVETACYAYFIHQVNRGRFKAPVAAIEPPIEPRGFEVVLSEP